MKIKDYRLTNSKKPRAQTAIEYLLLLAIVASVVLVAFKTLMPRTYDLAGEYYNKIANGIMEDDDIPVLPTKCFLEDVLINSGNASEYLTGIVIMSASGTDGNCQKNCSNCWCHWSENFIGCYEVADDSGNKDCQWPEAYIQYAWDKAKFPVKKDQVRDITIHTNLNRASLCQNRFGEDDDGWDMGAPVYRLYEGNWWDTQCKDNGKRGRLVIRARFDTSGFFEAIEVRARDHHDEGYFAILTMQIGTTEPIEVPCGP